MQEQEPAVSEILTSIASAGRQDTRLEAQGAEFLVLGFLLVHRISCYKAYVNFPGYDLIAVDPVSGKIARIQVKSRWSTDCDMSFPIKKFDCDFIVFAMLNRGHMPRKMTSKKAAEIRDPDFYVFPVEKVRNAQLPNQFGTVRLENIPNYQAKTGPKRPN